jgi:short-subunit dehydrogenase
MIRDPEWAVVTGASSGIGRAFALELARRGHAVLLVARRRARLEALSAEIGAAGGRAEVLDADLGTGEGVDAVVERVEALGGARVLVNDAGYGAGGRFVEQPLDEAHGQIALNVSALVALTYRLLPAMIARREGRIINLASLLSFMPTPYFAVYGATKAFVLSFSEALAHELRGSGVRVLATCPGPVKTEFSGIAGMTEVEERFPTLEPQTVARTSLRAIEGYRTVRIVGWVNKLVTFVARLSPRALMRFIMARMLGPGTQRRALPLA